MLQVPFPLPYELRMASAADSPRQHLPRPVPTEFSEPFWEGTRVGELRVQRCLDCQHWRWTPQLACPKCWSERYEWARSSGRGELYSFTVVRRSVDPDRFEVPYVLAVVRLDEGPHLLTNLVECELADIEVGMRVAVRFERIDADFHVYPFAPEGG